MARMVPAAGPRGAAAPQPHVLLYNALAAALDADYLVVHTPVWVGNTHSGTPRDGAADFLIAHPEHGILLLSVLGSGLAYDPHGDRWSDGTSRAIPDPFAALSNACGALADLLADQPMALPTRPVVGHAVVVPSIDAPTQGFASWAPRQLLIDRAQLADLAGAIAALFSHWQQRSPSIGNASNRWWWRGLENLFVAPRNVRPLLSQRIAADQQQILALSAQQVTVLEMLSRQREVTVYGPAGTGKTVLAVAKARSLAAQGYRVLLTCYNKALGYHLRDVCSDEPRVMAVHFHELCFELLQLEQRGVRPPAQWAARQRFFNEELPAMLIAAGERLRPFDALVVDEGQDFRPAYWRALEAISRPGSELIRYIFFDDRQQIFRDRAGAGDDVPGADNAIVLRTNWRNTQQIHTHIGVIERSMRDTPCAAPPGVPVMVKALKPTPIAALHQIVRKLVRDEGIARADIVILTGKAISKSSYTQGRSGRGADAVLEIPSVGSVAIKTVHAFKGLESPVVILTELQQHDVSYARQLFYIGASRAMSLLVVMADADVTGATP